MTRFLLSTLILHVKVHETQIFIYNVTITVNLIFYLIVVQKYLIL